MRKKLYNLFDLDTLKIVIGQRANFLIKQNQMRVHQFFDDIEQMMNESEIWTGEEFKYDYKKMKKLYIKCIKKYDKMIAKLPITIATKKLLAKYQKEKKMN